jgi:DNA invertase Pin-like site-specific DNA recombinase
MTRSVALYTRVSTEDQDCARQVRDLEAWAARMGWTIVARFTDKASGAKVDREARACVMRSRGAFDAILVTEASRWSRSIVDLVTTLDTLAQRGVSVLCLNGLSLDISTPSGKLMTSVVGAMAEFERDLIRERIKSGMAHKKAQGGYIGGRIKGAAPQQKRIAEEVRRLRDGGMSWRDIASVAKVSINTARSAYTNPTL